MIKLKTTADIILNIEAEQVNDAEVAQVLVAIEQRFNLIGIIKVSGVQVGVRLHISGDVH